mmetsp:Transcript_16754/g.38740  ORF Transcript_16754/g.38740 Transcript_16754/m.38740 type:complete len:264 (-) Transcript_16754:1505-2296(-)
MRPNDQRQGSVCLQELLNPVRTKLHNAAGTIRVPRFVQGDTADRIAVRGVTPKQVRNSLFQRSLWNLGHVQRPLEGGDLCNAVDRTPNTAMQTQDAVVYDGTNWEPFKSPVEFVPTRVRIFSILVQATLALIPKAVKGIDGRVLMVAPNEVNLAWILHLKCKEQAHSLQREATTVHKVTQEKVIHGVNVTTLSFGGGFVPCEESHQVQVLPMDVPIDLDRGMYPEHHLLLLEDFECLVAQTGNLHGMQWKTVRIWVRLPTRRQ